MLDTLCWHFLLLFLLNRTMGGEIFGLSLLLPFLSPCPKRSPFLFFCLLQELNKAKYIDGIVQGIGGRLESLQTFSALSGIIHFIKHDHFSSVEQDIY